MLEKQACATSKRTLGNYVVHYDAQCPIFRVGSSATVADRPTAVKIEILNDVRGFARYLDGRRIVVYMQEDSVLDGRIAGNRIETATDVTVPSDSFCAAFVSCDIVHRHYSVRFDGTRLRPDDETDLYVAFYVDESTRHAVQDGGSCLNCAWTAGDVVHYLTWCLRTAPNVGQEGIYKNRVVGGSDDDNGTFPTARHTENVLVECPQLRIRSVEPLSAGRRAGATTVRVRVTNHRIAVGMAGSEMNVTVAGRRCEVRPESLDGDGGDTIACDVRSPAAAGAEGPVEVAYLVDGVTFRLVSARPFRFARPALTAARPDCGPAAGGTRLVVTGADLSAVQDPRVTVGNVTCESTAVTGPDRVVCVTGASAVTGPAPVRIVDGSAAGDDGGGASSSAWFTYASEPALDAGQRPTGIASGGTGLPVRGRGFSCAAPVVFYAIDPVSSARRVSAPCRVHNDTLVFCRPPRTEGDADRTAAVRPLRYGLLTEFGGRSMDLTRADAVYAVYPDPALDGFVVDGRAVIVRGRGLGRGYGADDVSVRFAKDADPGCAVAEVDERRIVCEVTSSAADVDLDDVFVVWVNVGRSFEHRVRRKFVVSEDVFGILTT